MRARSEAGEADSLLGAQRCRAVDVRVSGAQFTCFTGTKVQILTLDAARLMFECQVRSLLALLVQKYKY